MRMVKLTDIVTDEFLQRFSTWESVGEFMQHAPVDVNHDVYWQYINNPAFDQYIAEHTHFFSWNGMLKRATQEFIGKNVRV